MRITGAVLEDAGRSRPFADSRPIVISEVELDPPGAGEVLVRIEAAGLCHSDLSVVDGSRVRPLPMLLGHEAAGIVVETGTGVTDVRPGQRVIATFLPRCGRCPACLTDGRRPCTPGTEANTAGTLLGGARRLHRDDQQVHHHVGVSAFATHAVIDRRSLVPVDSDVPPDVAAVLGCAVLTGGGAVINVGKPKDGETVLVVGLGGVGMAALLTAIALGKGPVIGVDTIPEKLEHATALGAASALTPADAIQAGIRAPVVIEAAGHARAFETALTLTAVGGITVTVGLPHPDAEAVIHPLLLTAEARRIQGSYLGSGVPARDIPAYIELWRAGRLPLERLISARTTLDDINHAMDQLAEGRAIRQIIHFDAV